jgi:hypothetical protein
MTEEINELLTKLDSIARTNDTECGLPLINESVKTQMRECVWDWLVENKLIEFYKPNPKDAARRIIEKGK